MTGISKKILACPNCGEQLPQVFDDELLSLVLEARHIAINDVVKRFCPGDNRRTYQFRIILLRLIANYIGKNHIFTYPRNLKNYDPKSFIRVEDLRKCFNE